MGARVQIIQRPVTSQACECQFGWRRWRRRRDRVFIVVAACFDFGWFYGNNKETVLASSLYLLFHLINGIRQLIVVIKWQWDKEEGDWRILCEFN